MNVTTIGLDLAKHVFQVHGADAKGHTVFKKRLSRSKVLSFFVNLPPCLIGMEACGGAHYWARELRALGHEVRLMPPQYVKPYVKRNKHDQADAEAICEAVTRPNMRFVAIKSTDQQSVLMLHRSRDLLVRQRTFKSGRQFAAWLGITPREDSTGGKARPGKISKRGDSYLRCLLIHGARSVVQAHRRKVTEASSSSWLGQLLARRHVNVATVAMANRNARIAWALMVHGTAYQPRT